MGIPPLLNRIISDYVLFELIHTLQTEWCPWPNEMQDITICDAGVACADVDVNTSCFAHDNSMFALVQLEHAATDCTVESAAAVLQKAGIFLLLECLSECPILACLVNLIALA